MTCLLQRQLSAASSADYELPLESRRPDVVPLVSGAVVVLELKGKTESDQGDLDQAAEYARDLRCYHRYCADREVHAVVVPTRAHGYVGERDSSRPSQNWTSRPRASRRSASRCCTVATDAGRQDRTALKD